MNAPAVNFLTVGRDLREAAGGRDPNVRGLEKPASGRPRWRSDARAYTCTLRSRTSSLVRPYSAGVGTPIIPSIR